MGRRHHRAARLARPFDAGADHDPVLVHRHWHRFQPRLLQQRAGRRIARIFHPDLVAGLEQRLQDQPHRAVVARGDEHLRRLAMDAARHLQIGGRCAAQRRQAAAGRIGQIPGLQAAQLPGAQPGPKLARKFVQRRQTHLERPQARRLAPAGAVAGRFWRDGHGRRRRMLGLQIGRHHGAGLAARLDIAFRCQQRIRHFHCAARHAQLLGQRPRRRNAVARLERALGDGAAKALINLPV